VIHNRGLVPYQVAINNTCVANQVANLLIEPKSISTLVWKNQNCDATPTQSGITQTSPTPTPSGNTQASPTQSASKLSCFMSMLLVFIIIFLVV
jgi:hypothetical protein